MDVNPDSLSEQDKDGRNKPSRFSRHLGFYLTIWPLLWLSGIEEFLMPIFFAGELVMFLVSNSLSLSINMPAKWLLSLSLWWTLHVFVVENMGLFAKNVLSFWCMFISFTLFHNCVRTQTDWDHIYGRVKILSLFIVLGGFIFILGIWQGSEKSIISYLLPERLSESNFFRNIMNRSLGQSALDELALGKRVMSIAGSYSTLSMINLLLVPWMIADSSWRTPRGLFNVFLVASLLVLLFFTNSRLSVLALLIVMPLYPLIAVYSSHKLMRAVLMGMLVMLLVIVLSVSLIFLRDIYDEIINLFSSVRSTSLLVRIRIYSETVTQLADRYLFGWGEPRQIPGMSKLFSAGTHSSILGVLYQQGIVGLIMYTGFWWAIWREIYSQFAVERAALPYLPASICAVLMFNLRELADIWWFDSLLAVITTTILGLIMSRKNFVSDRK